MDMQQHSWAVTLIVAIVLVVLAVLVLLSPLGRQLWHKSEVPHTDESPAPISMSRDQVAAHIVDFLESNYLGDGRFSPYVRCENGQCVAESFSEDIEFVGWTIAGLIAYRSATDGNVHTPILEETIQHVYDQCAGVQFQYCGRNFFGVRAAIESAAGRATKTFAEELRESKNAKDYFISASERVPLEAAAETFLTSELQIMYEATGDEDYMDALVAYADEALEGWPNAIEGEVRYSVNGVDVRAETSMIASEVLLPAYVATGDERYLNAVVDFYSKADLTSHLQQLGWYRGMRSVLHGVSGMITLSKLEVLSADRRAQFADMARAIMSEIISWQLDTPGRPLVDGSGGILTGVFERGEPLGVNYKQLDTNGWLLFLLMDSTFSGQEYMLPAQLND